MKTQYPYIIGDDGLTVYIDGKMYTISSSDSKFDKAVKLVTKGASKKKLIKLFDRLSRIRDYLDSSGRFKISDGVIYYDGQEVVNSLTTKILAMMDKGLPIEPMVNFFTNLRQNPSKTAQQELYLYLEAGDLPITPDGCFLSYKAVRDNYKDYHSGRFDNSVGSICEMPRYEVDDNREVTCSTGLHAAQLEYAKMFGGDRGHLMVIKINPRDVCAIPKDYNNTKLRCCRYEVVDELREAVALEDTVYGAWNEAV